MGLELATNIGILIGIVGFMLFFLRRLDSMKDELKSDMGKMESDLKEDMRDMESRIIADANLKHGEVREDLRDLRVGFGEVREGQARLEGMVEGMGRAAELVASAD